MAKYSKAAQKSVESSMKRMEKGKLESGKSGKKVTNPKQAIAIGLSEARKKGAKVPQKAAPKKSAKKAAPKKTAAKKAAPKKATPKKAVKKSAPKKAAAPKKSAAPKKAAVKKAVPKKAAAKKQPAKKAVVKKATGTKKATPAKQVFADKDLHKKTAKTNANNEPAGVPEYNETVDKVANTDSTGMHNENGNDNNTNTIAPPIEQDGLKTPEKIEDPVVAQDQHVRNKAIAKGDPHQKLHLSGAKGSIKPSGKKPLWNR